MKEAYDYFEKYLDILRKEQLYPNIVTVDGPSIFPIVKIKGKEFLSFSSNNYLGLAGDGRVKKVVIEAISKYGIGSGSTRLLSGTLDIQLELEKVLANFFGSESVITFSSGYLANIGVIRMLIDPFPYFKSFFEKGGIIISDELNHASIIDSVRLAKSEREIFPHSDMKALERILSKNKRKRKLILTDGIFSMDGDLANLKDITKLADDYGAILMVDDSHGVGVLGPHGEGTAHELGVSKGVDVIMGSFTKAFGSIGGFVTVNNLLSDYLRITARSYIFSDPIPPAFVAGLIEQTNIIKNGDDLRTILLGNSNYLRSNLREMGFTVYGEKSSIIPLIIGNEKKAMEFSNKLAEKNILGPCIRRPAVLEGKERIRFSLTASHSKKDVDKLLSVCKEIGKFLKLIK